MVKRNWTHIKPIPYEQRERRIVKTSYSDGVLAVRTMIPPCTDTDIKGNVDVYTVWETEKGLIEIKNDSSVANIETDKHLKDIN